MAREDEGKNGEECNYDGHTLPCTVEHVGEAAKADDIFMRALLCEGAGECTREIRARVPRRPINRTHFETRGISRASRESSRTILGETDRGNRCLAEDVASGKTRSFEATAEKHRNIGKF